MKKLLKTDLISEVILLVAGVFTVETETAIHGQRLKLDRANNRWIDFETGVPV